MTVREVSRFVLTVPRDMEADLLAFAVEQRAAAGGAAFYSIAITHVNKVANNQDVMVTAPVQVGTTPPTVSTVPSSVAAARNTVVYRVLLPAAHVGPVAARMRDFIAATPGGYASARQIEDACCPGETKSVQSALHNMRVKGIVESVSPAAAEVAAKRTRRQRVLAATR